jgi:tetratricopeptide (TPR) repeat protein
VALADELGNDPQVDAEFLRTMAGARVALAELRNETLFKKLDEKEQTASRKYEEALVKAPTELAEAERLYREAIALWEEVLPQAANPAYRKTAPSQLALAFLRLADVQQQQGKRAEAEASLKKAIAYGESAVSLEPGRPLPRHNLEIARQMLADLSDPGRAAAFKLLGDKDQSAYRKYEEAQVKAAKGDAAAERLFREAIALWEEVLPEVTNPEYRKGAIAQLALTYLQLAELRQQQGKATEAEAAFTKAIDYGEKAVALDPARPLPRHNLEVARQSLARQREQAHQAELAKLWAAERFADIYDAYVRGIEQQERQVDLGKDREGASRLLAYRLDRFAWFLAHCPDGRVRDSKAAVRRARKATELQPDVADYWYTLAMVQYRNSDWRDSLAALEKLKAKEGGFDASAWFVVAMNRHQLQEKDEARGALRKAVEWIGEMQRKAEDNVQLRIQYELMRPGIEALRREAEALIEGKGAAGDKVG